MTPNAKAPVCRIYGDGDGLPSGRRGVWTEQRQFSLELMSFLLCEKMLGSM